MMMKVCKVVCDGRCFSILKDENNMYWGIEDKYISRNQLTAPLKTFSNMCFSSKDETIDAIENKIKIDRLIELEGLTAHQAALRVIQERESKKMSYYRIDKSRMKASLQEQIQRGLNTFGSTPQQSALFRVWCFMLVNNELTPIARMRFNSTITALKWFEDNGWVEVDEAAMLIRIK